MCGLHTFAHLLNRRFVFVVQEWVDRKHYEQRYARYVETAQELASVDPAHTDYLFGKKLPPTLSLR